METAEAENRKGKQTMKNRVAIRLVFAGMFLMGTNFAFGQGMLGAGGMQRNEGGAGGRLQLPLERALGLPGQPGRWWTIPRMVESLKLTEDEQKAMDGILLQHRERLIDLRADLQKAELKLETLVGEEKPEEKAILAQINQVAQARAELEKANARYLLAIWNRLTPEQRTLAREFRAGSGLRGGWGRGEMHPGGTQLHESK
jgi:Spy/CpxP family protein refolding chaperone